MPEAIGIDLDRLEVQVLVGVKDEPEAAVLVELAVLSVAHILASCGRRCRGWPTRSPPRRWWLAPTYVVTSGPAPKGTMSPSGSYQSRLSPVAFKVTSAGSTMVKSSVEGASGWGTPTLQSPLPRWPGCSSVGEGRAGRCPRWTLQWSGFPRPRSNPMCLHRGQRAEQIRLRRTQADRHHGHFWGHGLQDVDHHGIGGEAATSVVGQGHGVGAGFFHIDAASAGSVAPIGGVAAIGGEGHRLTRAQDALGSALGDGGVDEAEWRAGRCRPPSRHRLRRLMMLSFS